MLTTRYEVAVSLAEIRERFVTMSNEYPDLFLFRPPTDAQTLIKFRESFDWHGA